MNSMEKTDIKIKDVKKITALEREKLWEIYTPAHQNVSREQFFERTTFGFDKIAIFYHMTSQEIIGMSGFRIKNTKVNRISKISTIYIGLCFIKKEFRGNGLVQKSCIKMVLSLKSKHPFRKIYFWDDIVSLDSYLIFTNYVHEYYPSVNRKFPETLKKLVNELGEYYYHEKYNPATMCVRKPILFSYDQKKITQMGLENEHITFYLQKNQEYFKGDALMTIMSITLNNVYNCWKKLQMKKKRKGLQRINQANLEKSSKLGQTLVSNQLIQTTG